jgi:hypothetical protein
VCWVGIVRWVGVVCVCCEGYVVWETPPDCRNTDLTSPALYILSLANLLVLTLALTEGGEHSPWTSIVVYCSVGTLVDPPSQLFAALMQEHLIPRFTLSPTTGTVASLLMTSLEGSLG